MERSRGWARSAVSRAAKRVGGTAWSFKFTLICAVVGFALAWGHAWWLLRVWLPDDFNEGFPARPNLLWAEPGSVFLARVRIAAVTTALGVAPVFAAEAWLLLCDRLRTYSRRWIALPFAIATAGVVVAAAAAARAVPIPRLLAFVQAIDGALEHGS
jgi:Sec-independent protein secretion pathway component TatC